MSHSKGKVLVTGASGFLGSHICETLYHAGYQVHALIRNSSSREWIGHKWLRIHTANLFDMKTLERVLQSVDMVIHNAGALWGDYHKINYQGTQSIASASINAGIQKFIFISSLAAGGPCEGPYLRNDSLPDNPVSPYGYSKKAAEQSLQGIREQMKVVILRFPMIYGPRDRQGFRLFKTFKTKLNPCVGFRRRYLSVVYVKDAAESVVSALEADVDSGSVYPISDGQIYTFNKLFKIISKVWGRSALRIPIPMALLTLGAWFINDVLNAKTAFNPDQISMFKERYWLISPEKAARELDWKPGVDIHTGIKETIEWYEHIGWL